MCESTYAYFRCRQKHEQAGEDGLRLMEIRTCAIARQARVTCDLANREDVHETASDDPDEDCAECKGDTPPTTP